MNDKLVLELLKCKGFQNPETIQRIVSVTPNPSVTLEMLLGVYEPIISDRSLRYKKHRYDSHEELVEIIAVDELANTVTYKQYNPRTATVWFLTEQDKKDGIYVTERPSNYKDWSTIKVAGYNETEFVESINRFNEQYIKQVSLEDVNNILSTWRNYSPTPKQIHEDLF